MIMRPLLLQIYPYHYQMFNFNAQIVICDNSFDKLNGLLIYWMEYTNLALKMLFF